MKRKWQEVRVLIMRAFGVGALGVGALGVGALGGLGGCGIANPDAQLVVLKPALTVERPRTCAQAASALRRHLARKALQDRLQRAIWDGYDRIEGLQPGTPVSDAQTNTQSNNQFASVDEADTTKVFGDRLLTIDGARIQVARVGVTTGLDEPLVFSGRVRSMALNASGLLAVVHESVVREADRYQSPAAVDGEVGFCTVARPAVSTRLGVVDLNASGAARYRKEIELKGELAYLRVDAERIVALSNEWVYGQPGADQPLQLLEAFFQQPGLSDEICATVAIPSVSSLDYQVNVTAVDVGDLAVHQLFLLDGVNGQAVQYDGDKLYVASRSSWLESRNRTHQSTSIYKIGFSPTGIALESAGEVAGHPINSYAMSAHEGVLRLAVDDSSSDRRNQLVTLGEQGARLQELGRLVLPGSFENTFAVRFEADRAYVVTFLQTDPLFVIDLSDAAKPRLLGELHVPGFSTHLRRVGPSHLLGVGTGGQWNIGGKLSLFDVSDASAPRESSVLEVEFNIGSEAAMNPQGLTFDDAHSRVYLPLQSTVAGYWGWYDRCYSAHRASVLVASWAGATLSRVAELAAYGRSDEGDCRQPGSPVGGWEAGLLPTTYVRAHRIGERVVVANQMGLLLYDASDLAAPAMQSIGWPEHAEPEPVARRAGLQLQ